MVGLRTCFALASDGKNNLNHAVMETLTETEANPRLDICALLKEHEGRNYELHAEHVNPANVRTLRTIRSFADFGFANVNICYTVSPSYGNAYYMYRSLE